MSDVKILIKGDASSAEKAFRKASSAAERSMKLIVAAGAAAAAAFAVYSVKAASDFSSAVSDLSAITGATGDELKFLSDKAREFGATTTLTATQSAEAFKLIASAKPDLLANGEALAEVTRQTITLAEASGVQLSAAANTVGSALNQFGAEADEAARFVNVLAAGSKFGASSVEAVSQSLKIAGTVAKGAGLSFEETNAAIQAMGAVALKGSEAGTGLRGVLLKLSSQSRDEFNPEIVGFTGAMKNLAAANLSTTEKTKLFGLESITAANALISQADSLDTLTDKLTGTSVALEQARIRNNNLEGDVRRQISAFESLAITSGDVLNPSLRVLVQGFTQITAEMDDSLQAATKVQSEMDRLTITFAQAADVIGNAAHGIALPFLVVGDAIGAVAAQMSFLAEGEFKLAMQAGEAGFDSMKQRLLEASDPAITSRFENIALEMIKINSLPPDGGNAAAFLQAIDAGATQAEAKAISLAQALADRFVDKPDGGKSPVDDGEGLAQGTISAAQMEAAQIEMAQHQADILEMNFNALEALRLQKEEFGLNDAQLETLKFERKMQELEVAQQWTLDNNLLDEEVALDFNERKELLEFEHQSKILDIKNRARAADMKAMSDSAKFSLSVQEGNISGILGGAAKMTAGLAKHNRAAFEANKAFATGQVIVDGVMAIQKAASAMPFPANIPGVVFETLSAAGRLAAVQSASFGGGGSIPTSQGGSAGGVPSQQIPASIPPAPQDTVDAKPSGTDVSVSLGDEDALISVSAVRGLIERINDQIDDGVVIRSIRAA